LLFFRKSLFFDPKSQSLSQGYGSDLPTSLTHIILVTRGCSPWRPAAVMSTASQGLYFSQEINQWENKKRMSMFFLKTKEEKKSNLVLFFVFQKRGGYSYSYSVFPGFNSSVKFPLIFKDCYRHTGHLQGEGRCSSNHLTLSPGNLFRGSSKIIDLCNQTINQSKNTQTNQPKNRKTKIFKFLSDGVKREWVSDARTNLKFEIKRLLKRKENSSQGLYQLVKVQLCYHNKSKDQRSLKNPCAGSGISTWFPFDS